MIALVHPAERRHLPCNANFNKRWAPGDVYYACAIARAAGRPCREVVREWENNHGQGWGVIAQRMGIKPGSAQFHALKRGIVPTYDRWGRPIVIDADLRKDFPNRGHDHKAMKGKAMKGSDHAKSSAHKSDHAKAHKSAKSVGKADKAKGGDKGKGKSKGGKP
ncbi:MAG: hypothetical protein LC715_01090 [Gammaproteobacteria bacterium]|nr:hypothetical protein [Gammaproteobacteria bacterium]